MSGEFVGYIPTATPPENTAARSEMNHSGELKPIMATARRGSNPNLMKALLAQRTSIRKNIILITQINDMMCYLHCIHQINFVQCPLPLR